MSKKSLNTYQFPNQIQREYNLLMKSRESFLRNLTSAEQRKLETSYQLLKNVWDQNTTLKLNEILDQKYQGLREIQKDIETNGEEYAKIEELKLQKSMQMKLQNLNQRKSELNRMNSDFKNTVKIWKTDIIQREKKLNAIQNPIEIQNSYLAEKRNILTEQLTMKKMLLEQLMTSRENWRKKKEILDQLEIKLNEDLRIEEENCSKVLNEIQLEKKKKRSLELKRISETHQRNLDLMNLNFEKDLTMIEEHAKTNLMTTTIKLLENLKKEKLERMSEFPEKLKNLIVLWPYWSICQQNTSIENESKQLTKQLEQRLIKIGINKDDFLLMMDNNLVNSNQGII